MVKRVSVYEDFFSAMTLLGEVDEPFVAVKDTGKTGMFIILS